MILTEVGLSWSDSWLACADRLWGGLFGSSGDSLAEVGPGLSTETTAVK